MTMLLVSVVASVSPRGRPRAVELLARLRATVRAATPRSQMTQDDAGRDRWCQIRGTNSPWSDPRTPMKTENNGCKDHDSQGVTSLGG